MFLAISDRDTQWPRTEQLLAILIDTVRDLTWLTQMVNTAEGKPQPDRPPRIPRPGVDVDDDAAPQPVPDVATQHEAQLPEGGGVQVDRVGTYGSGAIPVSQFQQWWDQGGG